MISKKYLKLVDHMGNDGRVVEAARVSIEVGERTTEQTPESDEALIKYMAKMGHSSPFEHLTATFFVKVPFFTARQWMRHRTMSYNEVSGRYSSRCYDEFYIPETSRLIEEQTKDSRQGAGKLELKNAYTTREIIKQVTDLCESNYQHLISIGCPLEVARMILPLNTYTSFYCTANLFNWTRFLKLRMDNHAQIEIREYANEIHSILSKLFPLSMKYLTEYHIK